MGGRQVTPLQTYIDQDNDCEILPWPLMMNAPPSMRKPHVLRWSKSLKKRKDFIGRFEAVFGSRVLCTTDFD